MSYYDDFERRRKEVLGGKASGSNTTTTSSSSSGYEDFESRRKEVLSAPTKTNTPAPTKTQEVVQTKTAQPSAPSQNNLWDKIGGFLGKVGDKYKEASDSASKFLFGDKNEKIKQKQQFDEIMPLLEKMKLNEEVKSVERASNLQQEYPSLKANFDANPKDPVAKEALRKNKITFEITDTYNKKAKDEDFQHQFDSGKINSKLFRKIANKAESVDEVVAAANALEKKNLDVGTLSDYEKGLLTKYDNNELRYLINKSKDYVAGAMSPYYAEPKKKPLTILDGEVKEGGQQSAQFVEKFIMSPEEEKVMNKVLEAGETYEVFFQNFTSGLTGGFIQPQYIEDDTMSEQIAEGVGQALGTVAGIFTISGILGNIARGSTVINTVATKYPTVAKYAFPMVKNVVAFDAYGQLNPDIKNRFEQLAKDTLLAVPFTALGYVNKAIVSIPASFGLGFSLSKFDGADDREATIQGIVFATLDGLVRGGGKISSMMSAKAAQRIARVEAINTINEVAGAKLKPNATIDEISAAYRNGAKKAHPDVGGDANQFKRMSSAYDFLSGKKVDVEAFKKVSAPANQKVPDKKALPAKIVKPNPDVEVSKQAITVYRGTTVAGQKLNLAKTNGITGGESTSTDRAVAERFATKNGGEIQEYTIAPNARIVNHSTIEKAVADLPVAQKTAAAQAYIQENDIDVVRFDVPAGSGGEAELRIVNERAIAPASPNAAPTKTSDTQFPSVVTEEFKGTPPALTDERLKAANLTKKEAIRIVNQAVAAGVEKKIIVDSLKSNSTEMAIKDIEEAIQYQKSLVGKPVSEEFYINQADDGKNVFIKVEGSPVRIIKGLDTFLHKTEKEWIVSEGRTGLQVATGMTRASAVDNAKSVLEERKEELNEALTSAAKEVGVSPRYTKKAAEPQKEAPKPPEPTPQGGTPSKIAKSIERKAIEKRLTEGFEGVAGYDKITIEGQSKLAGELLKDIDKARAVIRGEQPLPDGLRGTSLIVAMEEYIKKYPSADLAYELANSPLVSETSYAAQELRLAAEREPDSFAQKLAELKRAREKKVVKLEEKKAAAKKSVKEETKKSNLTKEELNWDNFLNSIQC